MQNDPERRPGDGAAPPEEPEARASSGNRLPGQAREIGGPAGPEPTRYGDWEKGGRCIDF